MSSFGASIFRDRPAKSSISRAMRPKAPQKDRRHFYPKPAGKPGGKRAESGEQKHFRHAKPENWVYGLHAVQAAIANPRRKLHRAVLTSRAAETIGEKLLAGVRVDLPGVRVDFR